MEVMRWLALALVALATEGRAEFVAPAEGPVPFRRDKLPVDVDTMSSLSRQVLTLTGAPLAEGAPGWRGMAQMTALALALDPANRQARELLTRLQAGESPDKVPVKEIERNLGRAWQVAGWLEMPEAGPDAQALAACLEDVLVLADPTHPKAEERRESGELGAWKDWIAPESAFQPKTAPEPEETEPAMDETPATVGIALADLSVAAPMWITVKTLETNVLKMVPVHLKAAEGGEGNPLTLAVAGAETSPAITAAATNVTNFMARRHPNLGKTQGVFSWEKEESFAAAWNGASLSGTCVLLLDGAITGKAPLASTFAVVESDGKLGLPPHFWRSLRTLSATPDAGGRLILPSAAADYLTGLVVLDDAAFFLKFEVLLADTADQLCDLGGGSPKPELQDAYTRFSEIKKAAGGKQLGAFVAHSSTQARLNQLAASLPQHASARMLALQGSGNRPRFLQRAVLAEELRDALEPITMLASTSTDKLVPKQLDQLHEQSREKLDRMGGFIDIRDRDLHKSAVAAADSVRTLARMLDKKDDDYRTSLILKQMAAHRAAWNEYIAAVEVLTKAAGDEEAFPIPKPLAE
jgi:hypothetical protein